MRIVEVAGGSACAPHRLQKRAVARISFPHVSQNMIGTSLIFDDTR